MATSVINPKITPLSHNRYLYSSSSDTVITNGSQTLREGNFTKYQNVTSLEIEFYVTGYVNSLSAGYYLYIDNVSAASVTTSFKGTENFFSVSLFVDNIQAGSHTYRIDAMTQGSNTFTIPAWTNNTIIIKEIQ